MVISIACSIDFFEIPPIIIEPLSNDSGLSVEVLIKIPLNPSIALSSDKVPLSDNTQ